MVSRREPSLRGYWLGQQLRELREAAGFKLKEAGEYIQREQSTLSRMEAGIVPMRTPDVQALLNLYGIEDASLRQALDELSRDVWRKGWWERYSEDVARSFIDHAWLEERAQAIRWFEALVLPGLLQTEDYARAVIEAAESGASAEQVQRGVEFRMRRQDVLAKKEPPQLQVIVEESTLHRPVGGPAVMRAQLDHLRECADRSSIEVRVLPLGVGAHASPYGGFVVFDLAEPFPEVAYAQTLAGAVYVESAEARRFGAAYDRLYEAALGPAESSAMISAMADEMDA